jgi:hypothetical protein
MRADILQKHLEKYGNCPDCECENMSNGEGTLYVNEDTFKRTCKCGFEVEIKEGAE